MIPAFTAGIKLRAVTHGFWWISPRGASFASGKRYSW